MPSGHVVLTIPKKTKHFKPPFRKSKVAAKESFLKTKSFFSKSFPLKNGEENVLM